MRKSTKIVTAAAVAGLAFAGVSAFTASNNFAGAQIAPKTGYGETTVTGATVTSLKYNLSTTGDSITSADLVLAGDTSGSAVSMAYNGGNTFGCGTGIVSGTTTIITTYSCTTPVNTPQSTVGLTKTAVVVN